MEKIAVIGAGILGVNTAYFLSKADMKSLYLIRKDMLAWKLAFLMPVKSVLVMLKPGLRGKIFPPE